MHFDFLLSFRLLFLSFFLASSIALFLYLSLSLVLLVSLSLSRSLGLSCSPARFSLSAFLQFSIFSRVFFYIALFSALHALHLFLHFVHPLPLSLSACISLTIQSNSLDLASLSDGYPLSTYNIYLLAIYVEWPLSFYSIIASACYYCCLRSIHSTHVVLMLNFTFCEKRLQCVNCTARDNFSFSHVYLSRCFPFVFFFYEKSGISFYDKLLRH